MCDDPREAAKFFGGFSCKTVNLSVKTQLKYQKYCFFARCVYYFCGDTMVLGLDF